MMTPEERKRFKRQRYVERCHRTAKTLRARTHARDGGPLCQYYERLAEHLETRR